MGSTPAEYLGYLLRGPHYVGCATTAEFGVAIQAAKEQVGKMFADALAIFQAGPIYGRLTTLADQLTQARQDLAGAEQVAAQLVSGMEQEILDGGNGSKAAAKLETARGKQSATVERVAILQRLLATQWDEAERAWRIDNARTVSEVRVKLLKQIDDVAGEVFPQVHPLIEKFRALYYAIDVFNGGPHDPAPYANNRLPKPPKVAAVFKAVEPKPEPAVVAEQVIENAAP